MFVQFESADAKKKEAVKNKRLMLLRCAYLNGYFDERETEPMPEIIADGVKHCPTCGAPPKYFIDGDCPKCNPPISNDGLNYCHQYYLYGQVPSNPPWPRLEASIEKLAEQEQRLKEAAESICPGCAGHGDRRGQNGENLGKCYICLGTGVDPRRPQKCQHRNRTGWTGNKTICLHCGEIIGRDLETGEVT